ncbi:MAG: helix-turn-helix domain-containing protein [Kiritimatiellaeota bacterium]|nr:helix-turn-helix domain-containing protein [Kiritimatiellota bacterium]
MPNYTSVLNEEIARIAKKEVKTAVDPILARAIDLKKKVSALTKQTAELTAKLDDLEQLLGIEPLIDPSAVSEEEIKKSRITPKYIANIRKKLGLSKNEMAAILEINPNSIYLWESGRATPRNETKAKLIQLREMGKKEVKALLEEFEDFSEIID